MTTAGAFTYFLNLMILKEKAILFKFYQTVFLNPPSKKFFGARPFLAGKGSNASSASPRVPAHFI